MIKCCANGSVKIELPKDLKKIEKCFDYINEQKSSYLWIDAHGFDGGEPIELNLLKYLRYPEYVTELEIGGNFTITNEIYKFSNLNTLYYYPQKVAIIDIGQFALLQRVVTSSPKSLINVDKIDLKGYSQHNEGLCDFQVLNKMHSLTDLSMHGPKNISLEQFDINNLTTIFITQCNIKNINGIENLPKINMLCLSHCRSLTSIQGISQLKNIQKLYIDCCPKLEDIREIGKIPTLKTLILENIKGCDLNFLENMQCALNLECLVLRNCNKIDSIKFLNNYPKLQAFDSLYTDIVDGDLNSCLRLESVRISNKRHYNLKEKDLPFGKSFINWWHKKS